MLSPTWFGPGKVRYIGCSTFPAYQIVESHWVAERRARERFACEQPPYSILTRGIEADVLPVCQKYGMGVIPWSPLAGGWLSGTFGEGKGNTSRRSAMRPERYDLSIPTNRRKLELVTALGQLADRGRADPDRAGPGFRGRASGGHGPHHRATDHGTPRVPTRCG